MREIRPIERLDAVVRAPGSKSITNRGLVLAALARGESVLRGALRCEDTAALTRALRELGFRIQEDPGEDTLLVRGGEGHVPSPGASLDVGSSGTALRVLTALCCLGTGEYVVDGEGGLRRRPVEALCAALRSLGANASAAPGGGAPVRVSPGSLAGGEVEVEGSLSSQFASALLLIGPCLPRGLSLRLTGRLVSAPYLDVTAEVMARFGAEVGRESARDFRVAPGPYRSTELRVEGDATSASYLFAAAAVTGGRVRVTNLPAASRQGDLRVLDVLERMGCSVRHDEEGAEVRGGPLSAVDVELTDAPDLVPTVAAVAMTARGSTRIRGVPHLRVKESDRIETVLAAVRALGGRARAGDDDLVVEGPEVGPGIVDPAGDHRIAMAFSVLGLARPGIRIRDPGCVAKSFPEFFETMESLTA